MTRALTPQELYQLGASIGARQEVLIRERAVRGIHDDRDLVARAMIDELAAAGYELFATATGVRVVRTAAPSDDACPVYFCVPLTEGYVDHFAPLLREALLSHPCLICSAGRVPLEGMRCDRCAET